MGILYKDKKKDFNFKTIQCFFQSLFEIKTPPVDKHTDLRKSVLIPTETQLATRN
jgi:hypothetical protein